MSNQHNSRQDGVESLGNRAWPACRQAKPRARADLEDFESPVVFGCYFVGVARVEALLHSDQSGHSTVMRVVDVALRACTFACTLVCHRAGKVDCVIERGRQWPPQPDGR